MMIKRHSRRDAKREKSRRGYNVPFLHGRRKMLLDELQGSKAFVAVDNYPLFHDMTAVRPADVTRRRFPGSGHMGLVFSSPTHCATSPPPITSQTLTVHFFAYLERYKEGLQ